MSHFTHVVVVDEPVEFSTRPRDTGAGQFWTVATGRLHVSVAIDDLAGFAAQLRAAADDLEAALLPEVIGQATEIINGLAEVDCG